MDRLFQRIYSLRLNIGRVNINQPLKNLWKKKESSPDDPNGPSIDMPTPPADANTPPKTATISAKNLMNTT